MLCWIVSLQRRLNVANTTVRIMLVTSLVGPCTAAYAKRQLASRARDYDQARSSLEEHRIAILPACAVVVACYGRTYGAEETNKHSTGER